MSKKECQHEWLPLGNDRWSCKHCAMVKVGYIEELKQQLAEKDKEIEKLKDLNNFLTGQNKDLILDMGTDKERIRYKCCCHQICTLIRSRAREIHQIDGGYYYVIAKSVLDQIEKGEYR